ncbi:hypothetical protein C8Q69DRAFT_510514 [Paecilomyces variotii]|uniref:Uncharacterized protein n=1 Tax=Byssochlamys spectabilis TaxID=264951 RepID=A0A443HJR2_BYSSP|nr:hypothetical protein C8Q69DRAFT_510514 [Paecilomyces variotii]KAJ9205262.1 hypothetical protein DTO032I3_2465 [Paecilomyces variotii]KAJ9280225.1 hypothetical protein DTO021D3_2813 [Paecilomyces variotii]KAJ9343039.1 hypothetical protein DTO027B6_4314 [Paecilomyces variotii]KAJ9359759.1 hypothetical protein DTO027B9_1807 [Paecilomyces variotii]KAJ9361269.1 hypothetical protein DTO280E4_4016 [Paecilomyces variotii]
MTSIYERALLRDKYNQALSGLVERLDSQAQAAYGQDELTSLGISLRSFDPYDRNFLNSKACLFRPMTLEEFRKYSFPESELDGGGIDYYIDFDASYDEPANMKNVSPSIIMRERAFQTYNYLQVCYVYLRKQIGRDDEYLEEITGWSQIKHDNSFWDNGQRLMYGHRGDFLHWDTYAQREWQDDDDNPETLRPHIILLICTGAEAKDNELLLGELGPIAQAIENRLQQKEFEKTSLFPVLAISLFGPRHGRLLQAHFDKSGILKVLVSPIYSFLSRTDAPSELFLRYYVSEPQDGPEYEFWSEEEDTAAQTHQYVAPLPGSDIENIPPKEGDVLC